jgi:hypothetical protein
MKNIKPDTDTQRQPALSIRQPWAELILRGVKTIELRKWQTDYRGPIWLHAAKTFDSSAPTLPNGEEPFHGGFVGCAVLASILPIDERRWEKWRHQHCDKGLFVPGMYGWLISNVLRFKKPIVARGFPGLFYPEPEDLRQLLEAKKEQCDCPN